MSYIMCDIESDGPIPHKYSMICFGAIIVEPSLSKTFYGQVKPISDIYIPETLAISGFSREQHLCFDEPEDIMIRFEKWIIDNNIGKPTFISDNNGYDFAWISYYMWYFLDRNIFGWSSRRIGDLYCGFVKESNASWKHLRITPSNHFPVNDAKANAEVLLKMKDMGLKIKLI
jgi:hypothetical protein